MSSVQALFNLKAQQMGFNANQLLVFRMNPSLNGYRGERLLNFYEEAMNRIQSAARRPFSITFHLGNLDRRRIK